ncbi:Ldh family oxidoreductase [Chthonobacter rhizosphaerae]|uniref:Ldh family oxidoreductase n=1 Tax=Chthonobacter rhizosphaerae TaxID=2735553 RepID=UPI0015EEC2F0|nr:Ldh family oxidoreductase [Chthonobacter rhizosphaerae]
MTAADAPTGRTVTVAAARAFAVDALVAAGTDPDVARSVANALVLAEMSDLKSHGLVRLESYAAQVLTGKVDGRAVPSVRAMAPAVISIDAGTGFSYPAIDTAVEALPALARSNGVAAAGIHRAHHAGAIGLHVETLAETGLVALMVANAPASIAPWGGTAAVFGTNPIAIGCPRPGADPIVVDLSVAKVARGNILAAAQRGEPIPEGWAVDRDGRPTTDAKAALAGTMLPAGDAKGTALAFLVEILCAMAGGRLATEQSSLFTGDGPPPEIGHLIVAFDPSAFGPGFGDRIAALAESIEGQPGARLPGSRRRASRRRAEDEGLPIPASLEAALHALIGRPRG